MNPSAFASNANLFISPSSFHKISYISIGEEEEEEEFSPPSLLIPSPFANAPKFSCDALRCIKYCAKVFKCLLPCFLPFPLPLVVDDVLIHFDDARARAALAVLGELAASTQVLLFTHHARHVELAREAVADGRLVEHELEPAHASA